MNEALLKLMALIGIPSCLAASLIAFLITYEGYTRGERPDRKLAFKMALRTALATLAVFVVLVIGMTLALDKFVLASP